MIGFVGACHKTLHNATQNANRGGSLIEASGSPTSARELIFAGIVKDHHVDDISKAQRQTV